MLSWAFRDMLPKKSKIDICITPNKLGTIVKHWIEFFAEPQLSEAVK